MEAAKALLALSGSCRPHDSPHFNDCIFRRLWRRPELLRFAKHLFPETLLARPLTRILLDFLHVRHCRSTEVFRDRLPSNAHQSAV